MAHGEADTAARTAAAEVAGMFKPTEWAAAGITAVEQRRDPADGRECFRAGRMYLAAAEPHIGSCESWEAVDEALAELAREFADAEGQHRD